ncbi:MAG: hypothetical protein AAF907_02500 [Planctomycetota bacterium]
MTPLLIVLLAAAPVADEGDETPAWLNVRGGLPWTRFYLGTGGMVNIAFLGGSITEREGFRPRVEKKLQAKYPQVQFRFYNGGVSSTGSTTGLFRFNEAMLAGGDWVSPPDKGMVAAFPALVIAEAAVNDDQDERLSLDQAAWNLEGIARTDGNPLIAGSDLMLVHFVNPSMLKTIQAGGTPTSIAAHEEVAEHYAIPSVNVAKEVARRIDAGMLTWEQYGGTHPEPVGDELAAELIVKAIIKAVDACEDDLNPVVLNDRKARRNKKPLRSDAVDLALLLRPESDDEGTQKTFQRTVKFDNSWTVGVPDWSSAPGTCRKRFKTAACLFTDQADVTLTIDPTEEAITVLGLYILAGPDAGALEVRVPGEEATTIQLYHPFSKNLHYPRTVLLYRSDQPPGGPIKVRVVKGEKGGTAVRIVGVGLGFIGSERLKTDEP